MEVDSAHGKTESKLKPKKKAIYCPADYIDVIQDSPASPTTVTIQGKILWSFIFLRLYQCWLSKIYTPRIQSWWPHCHRPEGHQVQSRWSHTLQTNNMLVSGLHCLSQVVQNAKMLKIIAVRTLLPPLQTQRAYSRVKMETSPRSKICNSAWLPCILWQPSTLNDI